MREPSLQLLAVFEQAVDGWGMSDGQLSMGEIELAQAWINEVRKELEGRK